MKNILKKAFIALFVVGIASSCSDDDDTTFPPTDETIADILIASEDHTLLVQALEITELTATFQGEGAFTVFAPNNSAFTSFLGDVSLTDVPKETLTTLLQNHVLGVSKFSADLGTGYETTLATTMDDKSVSLYVNKSDAVTLNGVATVTAADKEATNGVVHYVDSVVGLPNLVTFATADPNFSLLVTALTRTGFGTTFTDLLSGEDSSPFTVFAPTNAAFEDLLARLNVSFDDITDEQLDIVLKYHVLSGANVLAADLPGITDGVTPATLQGETIGLNLENGAALQDKTGVDSEIIATDVQATNGVIHAIDKVLLPDAALDAIGRSITTIAANETDFSMLVAALKRTGLEDTLDQAGPFTVFAPTNAAFEALLAGSSIDDIPLAELEQLLLNHVVSGTVKSTDLETSYANTLATYADTDNALSLYINIEDGVQLNGMSKVSTPDVETRNGVIHIVDAVIELPTVVTFATADPTFSTLVSALTREDQTNENYVSTLQTPQGTGAAPFTVFAPTNDAFGALLTELSLMSLDDVPTATLTSTLNMHVAAGLNVTADDLADVDLTTLGGDITINASEATITDSRDRVSNIIKTDVQASNGVIHAINKVILAEQ